MTSIAMDRMLYFKYILELIKPKIAILVLVTTFSGMWLGTGGLPSLELTCFTLIGIGLAGASSSILNNYIDRNRDKLMERTRNRVLPTGKMHPHHALFAGVGMGVISFALLYAKVNLLTALLALGSILYYVCIYTMWLKRTTSLCTVLGGVAGALPPVMGLTAVGEFGIPALILFGILFIWQPPHFWALALIRKDEYRLAGFPILPVTKGDLATKQQMLIYTIILLPFSLLPYYFGLAGKFYLFSALALGLVYIIWTIHFSMKPFSAPAARRLFYFSIFYLALLYIILFLDCTPVRHLA